MTASESWGHHPVALIKGAGDIGTGAAVRLWRSGFAVAMTEVAAPTVVRRTVAFVEMGYYEALFMRTGDRAFNRRHSLLDARGC
jgi:hypothetical protein